MWLLTSVGFFGIVRKPGDDDLTVRARSRGDLEALSREYLPSMSPVIEGAGTDYPYRARAVPSDLAAAVARMVDDINYSNFKNAVAEHQGIARAHIYGEVWGVLLRLAPKASNR